MPSLPLLLCSSFAVSLLAQDPPPRLPLPSPVPPTTLVTAEVVAPHPRTAGQARQQPVPADAGSVARREAALRNQVAPPSAPQAIRPGGSDRLYFDTAADGRLWAMGQTWKASFDGRGFDYIPFFGSEAPRNFPLRVELQAASVAGEALTLRDGRPLRQGAQVRTVRGPLTEVVDLAPQQVEQSFVFDTLPARGAIAVEVALRGEFAAVASGDGVRMANNHGAIDYRKAMALDAAGNQLLLPLQWLGDRARIEIPAEFVGAATLPLVLDPLLTTIPLVPGLPANRAQRNPDVARLTVPGITAVSWTVTWSAGDEDAFVQLMDAMQNPIAGDFIDFTTENWSTPRIASNANRNSFLVVSEVLGFPGSNILGRLIDATAVMQPKIVIEGNGVGLPGNNFRPDVGGDSLVGGLAYYTVVFEKEVAAGNHDIYYKQINDDGTLRTTNPLPLDTGATMQSHPAISEQNGPGSVGLALVAWQSQAAVAPFDYDIRAAVLRWNGALFVPPVVVAASTRDERRPAVSSVANVIGTICAAIAWEDDFGTDNDIRVQLVGLNSGNLIGGELNLNGLAAAGAFLLRNQIRPTVETDGNRFAIGYSEFSGTDYDTYAATATYLPLTGVWRLEDERSGLGVTPGFDDFDTRMVADWNFYTPVPNSEYTIVGADVANNDINLYRYGGWVPGPFYSRFSSQCGFLGIAASGAPTVGGIATFTLVGAGPLSGFVFGFPGSTALAPCPACVLAVNQGVNVPGPSYSWPVPANPVFVGAFTLSVQGWTFGGNACLGAINLSDTIDFAIR